MRTALVAIGLFVIRPAYASDITLFGGFQRQGEISRSIGPFPPCSTVNPPGVPRVRCSVSPSGAFVTTTFEPGKFGVFGIRVAHGGAMFGLEHTLAFSPDISIYNSNLLVQTRGARIKPYATAGLGGVFTSKEDLPNPASVPIDMDVSVSGGSRAFGNKLALNYGGGVKLFTAPRLGARVDVRGYTVPNIKDPRQDQTLHLFEMSIGIVFSISK